MARAIPIIKLYNKLLVSIQLDLSDQLVLQLREDITKEIQQTGATGLIIEVSGVDILDSYIARSIRDIAQIAKLMGAHTIIAGLDPNMAVTLVEMGLVLTGVSTALNLESAIEMLSEIQSEMEVNVDELIGEETPEEDIIMELE